MQRIDALICPRWTIRVEPRVEVETGMALAVDGGKIVAVLPVGEADARFTATARHERPRHVLLPGLVNAHTRAGMTLLRGYADNLPVEQWQARIRRAESRWMSPELVADGTRLAIAEMLRGGITCFSDTYYYPDVVGEVALECGMRVSLGMIAREEPSAWAADADEYILKGLAVHDRYKGEALISTSFAPYDLQRVSGATLQRIRQLADELELPIHVSLHETAAAIEHAMADAGCRPLARMHELGLVTPALVGVHATHLIPAEIELLGEAGASIVHCPRSNLKLASGACRIADLRSAGVNVALGTDSAAANNRLDLWSELNVAALFGNFVADDPTAISPAAAIEMATVSGARSMNLADQIGSLVPGKCADVICVDLSELALRPLLDPLSQLVYAAARHNVTDVWIAGEHLLADGDFVRLDGDVIGSAAQDWERRLSDE